MRYGMAAALMLAPLAASLVAPLVAGAPARADGPAYTPVPAALGSPPGTGASTQASGTGAFTQAQRAEIVAVMRQAMRADPSILRDAVIALRDADARTEAADQAHATVANHAALLTGDVVAGNPVGDVTLTEFYDPRCPYCRRMAGTIEGAIADDRRLRVVYRLIPVLGGQSVTEARAILAAGRQGRYVAMQHVLVEGGETDIPAAAREAGVDPARLRADMADPAIQKQLSDNIALATALGVTGTPTMVIGSSLFPGEIEAADLRKAIAQARS